MKRPVYLLLFGLVAVTTTAIATESRPQGGPPPAMPVKAVPVKAGSVSDEVGAVGSLIANESVTIRPEIAGRITAIHFQEGEAVAAGARLVTLESAELQAQLAASNADNRLNRQRFERTEELYRKGFISSQALDEARGNLDRTGAREREDQAKLAKTEIRAPFAGTMGLRQVSPGAYVQPGAEIARLEDLSAIKLDFRVPEVHLARLRKDQGVSVRVDAWPADNFPGRIYALEPAVDERTRTVVVRARIPNPGAKLRPGMFARVALTLGGRSDALLVPEQALVPKGQENFVFRVVEGKAKLTKVKTGLRVPGEVEIVEGLGKGDVVVTDGQIKLQDGVPVSVMVQPPPAAATQPVKPAAKPEG